jgi:hypothetical protein
MLVLEIIVGVLSVITLFLAREIYLEFEYRTKVSNAFFKLTILTAILFVVLLIMNWDIFSITKALCLVSLYVYLIYKRDNKTCVPFWLCALLTIIAFIVSSRIYASNIVESKVPDITKETYPILILKDNATINEVEEYGTFWHIEYSNDEDSVYQYYYQTPDGNTLEASIPADESISRIYFIGDDEEPYVEVITETLYSINYNTKEQTRYNTETDEKYNIYIPEKDINSIFITENEDDDSNDN